MIQQWRKIGCGFALGVLISVPSAAQSKHPRLVSVDATKCATCHSTLIRGFSAVHAPVADDCTSCHDVVVGEDGTTVALAADEPDLCVMCHDDFETAVAGEMEAPHAPVMDSCLNCHQPHASEHEGLLSAARQELCIMCHDLADLQEGHGGQLSEMVDCTSCHQPHGSANSRMLTASEHHAPFADGSCDACHRPPYAGRIRLRARGDRVCLACHDDPAEDMGEGGSVHAALEGSRTRAGCLSCHNPHMSANPSLLTEPGPALCGTCHGAVLDGSTADTGHAPAAEDCLNCHLPHASDNQRLLMEVTPDLCVMCHDVEDADLVQSHLGADLGGLDCVSCHSPHGEGNEKLLAANVHAAILDGCDTCHEGSHDALMADGESELCLACHDDIGEAAAAAEVPHPAMEMARCADCHNPHASPQEKLVAAPAGGACTTCHDGQAAGEDEVAHGVITRLGCRVCHEPHGGSGPMLLRASGSDLCLACHGKRRVRIDEGSETVMVMDRFTFPAATARRMASLELSADGESGHPFQDHRVLGTPSDEEVERANTSFDGEMTCLTCHDPHKGKSARLFRWGARSTMEACQACHEK